MSQAKVDRYKEEKANRKENMKKAKRQRILRNTVTAIVVVCIAGWVAYSGYHNYENNKPAQKAQVDYTSISEYIAGLGQK